MKHDLPADLNADAAASSADTAAGAPGDTAGGGPTAPDFSAYSSSTDRDQHGGAPHGFFAWLRSLGLQRQPGWIGGVASGVAARIGIDPIIVRGILVVLAIFAAPVLLFYGVAWLLLPDSDGRIHLQRLLNGDPQPALAGIAIFVLLGLMTPLNAAAQSVVAGNFWTTGGWFWGWSGSSVIATIFNIAALAAITVFVVWLVRRSNTNSRGGGAPSPTTLAAYSTAPATDGGGIRSGDSDAAATTTSDTATSASAAAADRLGRVGSQRLEPPEASATASADATPTAEHRAGPAGRRRIGRRARSVEAATRGVADRTRTLQPGAGRRRQGGPLAVGGREQGPLAGLRRAGRGAPAPAQARAPPRQRVRRVLHDGSSPRRRRRQRHRRAAAPRRTPTTPQRSACWWRRSWHPSP